MKQSFFATALLTKEDKEDDMVSIPIIMAKATFASIRAKFCPIHTRGPQLNGKNTSCFFDACATPSENLSGLNSSTSSPQTSGS
ncbi:hypothetical protein CKAN_02680700 [Cinnamomum micranthum f. kanehirae]|uniref:Uncharacterized protein n=1 Tax=Cinnamomum micranthum f. kanehirae TaxID=337451 RepID=A0A3S3NLB4_9MAGN|nr:hypothetical protein CKAN_02680700 [Cinnamomum micranthum f. kanehirae]